MKQNISQAEEIIKTIKDIDTKTREPLAEVLCGIRVPTAIVICMRDVFLQITQYIFNFNYVIMTAIISPVPVM